MNQIDLALLRRSRPLAPTFTGMALDRAQTRRKDPSWVQRQLHEPSSQGIAAGTDGVLLELTEPRVARRVLSSGAGVDGEPILVGLDGARALFAVDLDSLSPPAVAELSEAGRVANLREAGAELPRPEAGLAAYLVALLNWHRRHRFCANCGGRTLIVEAGYARRCVRCQTMHFPRTDPVVIMLVESSGRVLLGHRTGWPAGRYSILAGFVSPGESAEEAVIREVREESGIDAHHPRFVASQPWPFPSSLMLGFEASADGGEPANQDGELDDVAWFSQEHIRAAMAGPGGKLLLPPPISIARFLIEAWMARQGSGR